MMSSTSAKPMKSLHALAYPSPPSTPGSSTPARASSPSLDPTAAHPHTLRDRLHFLHHPPPAQAAASSSSKMYRHTRVDSLTDASTLAMINPYGSDDHHDVVPRRLFSQSVVDLSSSSKPPSPSSSWKRRSKTQKKGVRQLTAASLALINPYAFTCTEDVVPSRAALRSTPNLVFSFFLYLFFSIY